MKTMLSLCVGVLFVFVLGLTGVTAQDGAIKSASSGIVNGRAIRLPKPVYSDELRAAGIGGIVGVNVVIDESGNVISAEAAPPVHAVTADGEKVEPMPVDPRLREAAENAARLAVFPPGVVNGQAVQVKGMILYNFGAQVIDADKQVWGVSGGVLNGKALSLPSPVYPGAALAVKATGAVHVQVSVDEEGHVISASAISGHPLLRSAATNAAREAKFSPMIVNGSPVKVAGVLTYNFVLPKMKN